MAKSKESFVSDYLKKKKLLSYSEYIKENTRGAAEALRKSVSRADSAYAEAKAGYGTRASSLLSSGLTASGYGDYLDGVAYAARAKATSAAEESYAQRVGQVDSGYAAYLASAEKEAEEAYENEQRTLTDAFEKLLDQKILDKTSAKAFLIGLGIDAKEAETLAERSIEVQEGTDDRKNFILNYVLSQCMSYDRAYNYAIANGLSREIAIDIAKTASAALKAAGIEE